MVFFDFEEGITVNSEQVLVIFTKAEPFGKNIKDWFSSDPKAASKYAFDELYTMQKSDAIQAMYKNRYRIKGEVYRPELFRICR